MSINLENTLFCGQTFAWSKQGEVFQAIVDGRVIEIDETNFPSTIAHDSKLRQYFDMDYEYENAESILSERDPYLASCIKDYGSIHILNQDPWEVLMSFLLSQNNNIKRITSMYKRLSETYGKQLDANHYTFPRPEELLVVTEADFRKLGMGFRAPYLVDAVANHQLLQDIPSLDFSSAMQHLKIIKGVGDKVASCILLFAYHRMEAFPLDTWMLKVMKARYPSKDATFFAPYAALAQQYLFHGERTSKGGK